MPAETDQGSNYSLEAINPRGIYGLVFPGKFPVESRY